MMNVCKKVMCCFISVMFVFVMSLTSCVSNDVDLECAEYIFTRNPEFVEKYGKIDSVKRIGESIDSDDKTERYVYCEITLKDGRVINCTAILELDEENKIITPLSWEEGQYLGE